MYAYGSAASSDTHLRGRLEHATRAVALAVSLLRFRAEERPGTRNGKLLAILHVVEEMQPQLRTLAAAPPSRATEPSMAQALQFQEDALSELTELARTMGWDSEVHMLEMAAKGFVPESEVMSPPVQDALSSLTLIDARAGARLPAKLEPARMAVPENASAGSQPELVAVVAALTALTNQLSASMRALEANRAMPYPMLPAYAPAVIAQPAYAPPPVASRRGDDDDEVDEDHEPPPRARRGRLSSSGLGRTSTMRLAGSGLVVGFLAVLGGISLANRIFVEESAASAPANAKTQGRLADYANRDDSEEALPPPRRRPVAASAAPGRASHEDPGLGPASASAVKAPAEYATVAPVSRLRPDDRQAAPPTVHIVRPPPMQARLAVAPTDMKVSKKLPEAVKPSKPAQVAGHDAGGAAEQPGPAVPAAPSPPTKIAVAGLMPDAEAGANAAPAKPAPGRFVAVLSTHKDKQAASEASTQLSSQYPAVMGGRQPEVQSTSLGQQGTWYRLVLGAGSRDEAAEICSKLRTAGYSRCWVKTE